MRLLSFKKSKIVSIGTELEFQIIDCSSLSLVARSKELMRALKDMRYRDQIKPEITQSMIEINSSIHQSAKEMYDELLELQKILVETAASIDIAFCGGGTHPFQQWTMQKIFPSKRFKKNLTNTVISASALLFLDNIFISAAQQETMLFI